MRDEVLDRLRATGCAVHTGTTLADLTLLRVGGPVGAHVEVDEVEQLVGIAEVVAAERLPWTVVGRGSNLLAADAGFPGIVLTLGRGMRGHELVRTATGGRLHADAGAPLPALAATLADAGLAGFAWAVGVPGNLGGAIRMNAGAHGGEVVDVLVSADLFRMSSATRETWPVETLGLRYRSSDLPSDAIVVAGVLELPAGDRDAERARLAEVRDWRRQHQPLARPNCGSVFTNPPDDSAGRLVEAAGCKGWRVGGAAVSLRHANFVVTRAGARAADVHALVELVRRHVAERTGVTLHAEVQRLGDFSHVAVPEGPDAVDHDEDDQ